MLEWTVVHFENGVKQDLRSGTCAGYEDLPELSVLDGNPVILWEDSKKETFGLDIFDGTNLSEIELPKDQKLVSTDSACNTKEICFLTENDAGDARFLIADKNGEIGFVEGSPLSDSQKTLWSAGLAMRSKPENFP